VSFLPARCAERDDVRRLLTALGPIPSETTSNSNELILSGYARAWFGVDVEKVQKALANEHAFFPQGFVTDGARALERLGRYHWTHLMLNEANTNYTMLVDLVSDRRARFEPGFRACAALSNAHECLGLIALKRGDGEGAVRHLRSIEKAVSESSRWNEAPPLELADALARSERFADVSQFFESLSRLVPRHASTCKYWCTLLDLHLKPNFRFGPMPW
jgi:hypothetical protein